MKKVVCIVGIFCVASVYSACTRGKGEAFGARFYADFSGVVVTNDSGCVRTVVDETAEYRYSYSSSDGGLSKVRVQYHDGCVEIYDYRDGRLDSAAWCSTNNETMVMTMFVGDGKDTNQVDRIETHCENGKITGAMRILDVQGNEIKIPKPSGNHAVDKEYRPKPGSTGRFGPYEWTIAGSDRKPCGILSRNGRKILLMSHFCLGGKYPWIVGYGVEEYATANRQELMVRGIVANKYRGARYYFVIDMRTDHVEYVPEDKVGEIDKIMGFPERTIDMQSFWGLFLSKRGPERLARLEEALKPPVVLRQGSVGSCTNCRNAVVVPSAMDRLRSTKVK